MNKLIIKSTANITLLVLFAVFILSGVSASANDAERSIPRFTDEVGLLTAEQAEELTAKLDEISARRQFDVVITVVSSIGSSNARVYAADFYEMYGFGFGENSDGIILMIAMEDRDWAFATTGHGEYVFTYSGQEYLEELFLPYLRNDQYFRAFMAFADAVDDFLQKEEDGDRYTSDNIPTSPTERRNAHIRWLVISIVIALIVPAIVVAVWTRQLKSVRPRDGASDYIREGSFMLRVQRDIFLYRNVTRTPRNQDSGGGKGGSSGSFRSSSGSSFSGRSGKF